MSRVCRHKEIEEGVFLFNFFKNGFQFRDSASIFEQNSGCVLEIKAVQTRNDLSSL